MQQHFANATVTAEISGVDTSGATTVWIFHSLLADAGSCRPLADRLAATCRVALADLPGFGGSADVLGGLEAVADRMAEAVAEFHPPAVIVANGYGTFAALLLALRHPHLVARLVLAGSGACFSDPGRQAFVNMANAAETKGLAAIADTAMARLFAADFQAANPALVAERRERFLAVDPAVFIRASRALATLDLAAQVADLAMPLLIVVGEQDEATPPAMARALHALVAGSRLAELPGLAHVPQLQDVGAFLHETGDFIVGKSV